jgi:hypothetical protein
METPCCQDQGRDRKRSGEERWKPGNEGKAQNTGSDRACDGSGQGHHPDGAWKGSESVGSSLGPKLWNRQPRYEPQAEQKIAEKR